MLGYIHQLLPGMTGMLGVATVLANPGYLPHTGPLPLRFRVAPPTIVNTVPAPVSPPFPPPFLPPYFPPVPIALPTPPLPGSSPDLSKISNAPPALVVPTNGPALEFDARDSESEPEAVVSPQMLLKYFASSTNASVKASTNAINPAAAFELDAPLRFTPAEVPTFGPSPPAGKAASPISH